MEYCEKGELFDYIVEKERLDPLEASLFFYQIINGVEYIHNQGFSHRDLKPENLLLTKDKMLKIIDFGLCHDFDENKALHTKCGSPSYAAPEILKGFPYNGFKTDIWCCGIILYAMLCGYLPFDGDDNQEIFQSIVECEPEFPSFLEEDIIILLLCLLNPEPKDRITIEEIKQHPFYLKGKHLYSIQYEGNDDTFIDEGKDDEIKNNNFMNSNTVEKKGIAFSTIRRKKGSIYTFNNIKNLRMKENKNKNNIYQNIFGNNNNEEECASPRLVIKDEKKKNNDEIEKITAKKNQKI
jgi:5'-AMP-activated protein kinase catalytic alpha subunit